MGWSEEDLLESSRLLREARNVNLILVDGGMGDMVAMLVPVSHLIRTVTHIKFHVWVGEYLVEFARHVLPKGSLVRSFSDAKILFNKGIPGLTTEWSTKHTPMRTHPVDYGFHMLADCHMYDLAQKNYLQIQPLPKNSTTLEKFNLPNRYVCIGAAAAEPVKAFSAEAIDSIARYVLCRGYTPIFMGSEKSKIGVDDLAVRGRILPQADYSQGINLLNRTSLLEAARVIAGAAAFVGIDGGLVHLAGCTDTPIVAGYTLADPAHLAPIRKGSQCYKFRAIEPPADLTQRYFQTKNYFYPDDYRTFPGWEKVVASLTAEKFIPALGSFL